MKKYVLVLGAFFFASCNGPHKPEGTDNNVSMQTSVSAKASDSAELNPGSKTHIENDIRSIFQDKQGDYWFGTNGNGVYRYDGKTVTQFTVKDGLSNNQVQQIQQDNSGNMWFGTGVFGVSCFDGKTFTTYTDKKRMKVSHGTQADWKIEPNDVWFNAGGGVYRLHGNSLMYLPLARTDNHPQQAQGSPYMLSPYAVYSILKDKKGHVWFGTQSQGVCRYDGKSFAWFTEKGLSGSAVLALFEDSNGILWFGNNGSGLFRYDGKSLLNVTEEKGLGNSEFKISGKAGPGTLARIYAINEDNNKNLWVGTVDAGVWKYDGNNLMHYSKKDGLSSDAINVIYKDRKGELWFGTDGDGICKFNGIRFARFEIR